jgi:hypothetical protein
MIFLTSAAPSPGVLSPWNLTCIVSQAIRAGATNLGGNDNRCRIAISSLTRDLFSITAMAWFRKLSRLLSQPGFSVVDYFRLSVIRTIKTLKRLPRGLAVLPVVCGGAVLILLPARVQEGSGVLMGKLFDLTIQQKTTIAANAGLDLSRVPNVPNLDLVADRARCVHLSCVGILAGLKCMYFGVNKGLPIKQRCHRTWKANRFHMQRFRTDQNLAPAAGKDRETWLIPPMFGLQSFNRCL